MPRMTNPETLRSKLSLARDTSNYWRMRAERAERELRIAARCTRDLLKARGRAAKWLALFDAQAGDEPKRRRPSKGRK